MELDWGKLAAAFLLVVGIAFVQGLASATIGKAFENGVILPSGPGQPAGQFLYLVWWCIFILAVLKILTHRKQ